MFLNKFGQPIPLKSRAIENLSELDINELSIAPLLLTGCGCEAVDYGRLLNNWRGDCVYSSKSILGQIKADLELHISDRCTLHILPENVATAVPISETETLSVTMIAIDAEANSVIYLTEDKYSRNLITDVRYNCLKAVQSNSALRSAISDGIDVLFIDDSAFLDVTLESHSNVVFELRALVALVRPNTCVRLYGADTSLLEFIDDYCREKDLYESV